MITFIIIWNTQNCGENAKKFLMLNVVLTHTFHCASKVQWYMDTYRVAIRPQHDSQ